jgi:predicted GNAT superfamily acetyltransferase
MSTQADVDVAVEVRVLDGMAEFNEAAEILRAVWGFPQVPPELMRALSFAGDYVAGAFADGALVAASVGFLAPRDDGIHLHSHIAGVVAPWQGRHVGYSLKMHQRDWALARDIATIEWTFDPLIRRNAFFNLVKLGAAVVSFEADFYGEMNDAINVGDPTDRAVAEWDLASPSSGDDAHGAVILRAGDDGLPVVSDTFTAPTLRAWVPEDAVALRQRDPSAGRAWRLALRDSFGAAIGAGYRATSMTRDGWYTLTR